MVDRKKTSNNVKAMMNARRPCKPSGAILALGGLSGAHDAPEPFNMFEGEYWNQIASILIQCRDTDTRLMSQPRLYQARPGLTTISPARLANGDKGSGRDSFKKSRLRRKKGYLTPISRKKAP